MSTIIADPFAKEVNPDIIIPDPFALPQENGDYGVRAKDVVTSLPGAFKDVVAEQVKPFVDIGTKVAKAFEPPPAPISGPADMIQTNAPRLDMPEAQAAEASRIRAEQALYNPEPSAVRAKAYDFERYRKELYGFQQYETTDAARWARGLVEARASVPTPFEGEPADAVAGREQAMAQWKDNLSKAPIDVQVGVEKTLLKQEYDRMAQQWAGVDKTSMPPDLQQRMQDIQDQLHLNDSGFERRVLSGRATGQLDLVNFGRYSVHANQRSAMAFNEGNAAQAQRIIETLNDVGLAGQETLPDGKNLVGKIWFGALGSVGPMAESIAAGAATGMVADKAYWALQGQGAVLQQYVNDTGLKLTEMDADQLQKVKVVSGMAGALYAAVEYTGGAFGLQGKGLSGRIFGKFVEKAMKDDTLYQKAAKGGVRFLIEWFTENSEEFSQQLIQSLGAQTIAGNMDATKALSASADQFVQSAPATFGLIALGGGGKAIAGAGIDAVNNYEQDKADKKAITIAAGMGAQRAWQGARAKADREYTYGELVKNGMTPEQAARVISEPDALKRKQMVMEPTRDAAGVMRAADGTPLQDQGGGSYILGPGTRIGNAKPVVPQSTEPTLKTIKDDVNLYQMDEPTLRKLHDKATKANDGERRNIIGRALDRYDAEATLAGEQYLPEEKQTASKNLSAWYDNLAKRISQAEADADTRTDQELDAYGIARKEALYEKVIAGLRNGPSADGQAEEQASNLKAAIQKLQYGYQQTYGEAYESPVQIPKQDFTLSPPPEKAINGPKETAAPKGEELQPPAPEQKQQESPAEQKKGFADLSDSELDDMFNEAKGEKPAEKPAETAATAQAEQKPSDNLDETYVKTMVDASRRGGPDLPEVFFVEHEKALRGILADLPASAKEMAVKSNGRIVTSTAGLEAVNNTRDIFSEIASHISDGTVEYGFVNELGDIDNPIEVTMQEAFAGEQDRAVIIKFPSGKSLWLDPSDVEAFLVDHTDTGGLYQKVLQQAFSETLDQRETEKAVEDAIAKTETKKPATQKPADKAVKEHTTESGAVYVEGKPRADGSRPKNFVKTKSGLRSGDRYTTGHAVKALAFEADKGDTAPRGDGTDVEYVKEVVSENEIIVGTRRATDAEMDKQRRDFEEQLNDEGADAMDEEEATALGYVRVGDTYVRSDEEAPATEKQSKKPAANVEAPAPATDTDTAIKELDDLFGGDALYEGMGDGPLAEFDPAIYAKAKPLLETTYKAKYADDPMGFIQWAYGRWGDPIKPYLKQFRDDLRSAPAPKTETKVEKPRLPGAKSTAKPIRDILTAPHTTSAEKGRLLAKFAQDKGLTLKDAQEAAERELVVLADEIARDTNLSPRARFDALLELYDSQPNMTARTSTSVENQAYSTPAPLAFALSQALGINQDSIVYDPTAGNGMLLIGANLQKSFVNELNDMRQANLKAIGIGEVTQNDATVYGPLRQAQFVMTNPPFGGIDTVRLNGVRISKLEHLIALRALDVLPNSGRAAIIVGAKMNPGPIGKGGQWTFENYLQGYYNVVSTFEVSGDLYKKQGAAWPVRILIVDGRKPNGALATTDDQAVVERLADWEQVWYKTNEELKNEISSETPILDAEGQRGISDTGAAPEDGGGVPVGSGGNTGETGTGSQPGGNNGGKRTSGANTGGHAGGGASGRVQKPANAERPNGAGSRPGSQNGAVEGKDTGTNQGSAGVDTGSTDGGRESDAGNVPRAPNVVEDTRLQVVYESPSADEVNPLGTLIPKNIADGVNRYLKRVKDEVGGSLAKYVAEKTGLSLKNIMSGDLAAEQVDGVALTIYQIERGGAMIIADEAGLGKGRQNKAVGEYAKKQGKVPIHFTENTKLFSDLHRDGVDIRASSNPLIIGGDGADIVDADGKVIFKAPAGKAEQERIFNRIMEGETLQELGYDSIYVTYSQISSRDRQQKFLEYIAENNDVILIMDEAHNAAGDASTSMSSAFFIGGEIVRDAETRISVPGLFNKPGLQAGRGGVMYLSATFAKTAKNMPIYMKTSLSKAADSQDDIIIAMQEGGIAMQQAVSEALAKEGQLIRRESDFTGVPYDMRQVKYATDAEKNDLIARVDSVADCLEQIVEFSNKVREVVKESNKGQATAGSQNKQDASSFASTVHNQISQLLLAAKADAVVQECIDSVKRGEKPVVALMNTMQAFLEEYVAEQEINNGETVEMRWNQLLDYILRKTLRVSTKNSDGTKSIELMTPQELGLTQEYAMVEELIKDLDVDFPVSPIDYIIQRLADADIVMGELTGRDSGLQYDFKKGVVRYRRFKKADKNTLVNGFNAGKIGGLLLNRSGSTGLSIHASKKFADYKPRHMIIAQASLDINIFVQTLGRIKRTGLVEGGARYTHLVLPVQAEIRPAAKAKQKLASLNAATTADAESQVAITAPDIMNKYGDRVVTEYLMEHPQLARSLNINLQENTDGTIAVESGVAGKFTGRMTYHSNAAQKTVYDDILPAYNDLIEILKSTGEYDLEVTVHDDWNATLQKDEVLKPGTDESSIFTASTRVQDWEIRDTRHVPTGEEMLAEIEKKHGNGANLTQKVEDFFEKQEESLRAEIPRINESIKNANAKTVAAKAAHAADPKNQALKEDYAYAQKAVAAHEADLRAVNSLLQRLETSWQAIKDTVRSAGKVVTVEAPGSKGLDTSDGMLIDVKLPKLDGHRYAPSNFRFTFLLHKPGGRLYLSGTNIGTSADTQFQVYESGLVAKDLEPQKGATRYTRTFITGNPIAALAATDGRGQMVRFHSDDVKLITGLQMPVGWTPANLTKDPRLELVNGAAVAEYLNNGYQRKVEQGSISMGVGEYGRIFLNVPASRRSGGTFFLNEELRAITGDFVKSGGKMVARVPTDEIAEVADIVTEISGRRWRAYKGRIDDVAKANPNADTKGRAEPKSYDGITTNPTASVDQFVPNAFIGEDSGDYSKQELKLFQASRDLIKKYGGGKRVMEGRNPRKTAGVSYTDTRNIAVASLINIGVAVHETAHNVDVRIGLRDRIGATLGEDALGRPLYPASTGPERRALTRVYELFYPRGRKTDPLKKRIVEGFAMFVQKYIEDPNKMRDLFPGLAEMIVDKGGKYYDPEVAGLIRDARKIVNSYHQLDPLQKIGTRIKTERRKAGDAFLNTKDRLETFWLDRIWPLEKVARIAGVEMTADDPSIYAREYDRINRIFAHNIKRNAFGKESYMTFKGGEYKEIFQYNWFTLMKTLTKEGLEDTFSQYLVARWSSEQYKELDVLEAEKNRLKQIWQDYESAKKASDKAVMDKILAASGATTERELWKMYYAAHKKWVAMRTVLQNDNLDRELVDAARAKGEKEFPTIAGHSKMFDSLVRADLDLMYEVGLLTDEEYERFKSRTGYVTFKRDVFNDLIDPEYGEIRAVSSSQFQKKQVSSLIRRKGSEKPIIDPLYASIVNHNEILRKALRQTIWNKLGALAEKDPEAMAFVMQQEPLKRSVDKEGRHSFPQDRDANVVMVRKKGKRIPYAVNNEIAAVLQTILTPESIGITEKFFAAGSRIFTKGTTGWYPAFAAMNILVDQVTATAQTRTGYLPLISQIKMLTQALSGHGGEQAQYIREYMILVGASQTLTGWNEMSPDEAKKFIANEAGALGKLARLYERAESVIGAPAQASEIFTRAAEYARSRMEGDTQLVSIEKAGRVTAPFHHRGRFSSLNRAGGRGSDAMRAWVRGLPYFNAGMQVAKEYAKAFADPERRVRASIVTGLIIGAKAAELIPLLAMATDDQREKYKQLQADYMARYIVLPHWNGVDLIRLRMPEQMLSIGAPLNMFIQNQLTNSKYSAGEMKDAALAWVPDQFDFTEPTRMFFSWVPQVSKPTIEVLTNTKTWPNASMLESQGVQNERSKNRTYRTTSPFAKELALKVADVVESLGGESHLSPIQIDHLLGGFGRSIKLLTKAESEWGRTLDPYTLESYFAAGRTVQNFYDKAPVILAKYADLKEKKETMPKAEAKQLTRDYELVLSVKRGLKQYKDLDTERDPKAEKIRAQIIDAIDAIGEEGRPPKDNFPRKTESKSRDWR